MTTPTRIRRHLLVVAGTLCLASDFAGAQVPSLRADSLTLGDVVRSLTVAGHVGRLDSLSPAGQRVLDSLAGVLSPESKSLSVARAAEAIGTANDPKRQHTFGLIVREQSATRTLKFRDQVLALNEVGNVEVAGALRSMGLPRDSVRKLLRPLDTLTAAIQEVARDANRTTLERFERKYGPSAPQLNYLEVLLNYGAQFVPPFRTTENSGPSPLELIASYSTLSVKLNDSTSAKMDMVSVGRVGVRVYFFGKGWGQDGRLSRYLKPAYGSIGVLTLGPQDDPLQRVWGRGSRAGPFIGWGELFAGYVIGSNHGLIVGTQKLIIPRIL